MIYGIGVDTASVERIEKSMKSDSFMRRVFGADELCMFEKKNYSAETVAANFAAKEALSKALGCGIMGFSLCEAQALRGENGVPYYKLSGKLEETIKEKKLRCLLSLTHEGGFATAFAVLEEEEN